MRQDGLSQKPEQRRERGLKPRAVASRVPPRPPVLPGFERLSNYYEMALGLWVVQLLPGDFYVTKSDELLTTVLGSCIAACIRDPRTGIAGMNHFMLPQDPSGGQNSSARYGAFAMEQLINGIMRAGGERASLEIKIFGGGRVIAGLSDIGQSNIDFVHEFLAAEGFPILVEDVGLTVARRVRYQAATGKARVLHLPVGENQRIAAREAMLAAKARDAIAHGGDIELFEPRERGKRQR